MSGNCRLSPELLAEAEKAFRAMQNPSAVVADLRAEMERRIAEARAEGERKGLRRAAEEHRIIAEANVRTARYPYNSWRRGELLSAAHQHQKLVKLFRKMAREVKP